MALTGLFEFLGGLIVLGRSLSVALVNTWINMRCWLGIMQPLHCTACRRATPRAADLGRKRVYGSQRRQPR
jgi:hypothetical protein